jgi:hypothetical protein
MKEGRGLSFSSYSFPSLSLSLFNPSTHQQQQHREYRNHHHPNHVLLKLLPLPTHRIGDIVSIPNFNPAHHALTTLPV